jgi:hypothetical protein
MIVTDNPFSKGPALKFLDSTRQFEVVYRYRLRGEAIWNLRKIGITARSPKHSERRCIEFISQRHDHRQVEVMRVTGLLAIWIFWLGYCLVLTELHARLNIQRGNVAIATGRMR